MLYLGVEICGVSWALPSEHGVATLFPSFLDDIAEVEDPSAHGADFRISQFTHFTHDFPPYPDMFAGMSATLR